MNVTTVSSAGWTTFTAWAQAAAAEARLSAHLASGAAPQVIAADRATLQASGMHLARQAGRVDILV
jgi:hypothetical protein